MTCEPGAEQGHESPEFSLGTCVGKSWSQSSFVRRAKLALVGLATWLPPSGLIGFFFRVSRRKGRQRMRWLDGITQRTVSLCKLRETARDGDAQGAAVRGAAESQTRLSDEQQVGEPETAWDRCPGALLAGPPNNCGFPHSTTSRGSESSQVNPNEIETVFKILFLSE